jgi:hypothetical protein
MALGVSAAVVALAAVACNERGRDGQPAPAAANTVTTDPIKVPDTGARVTLHGSLTLDGAPIEARFLGVRVVRDRLAAACQITIPAITQGR